MRIILVGFGNVGRSFVKILNERGEDLLRLFGLRPRVVAIIDRGGASVHPHNLDLNKVLRAKHYGGSVSLDEDFGKPGLTALEVIDGVEADVVVEVTPSNIVDGEPGLSHIEEALKMKRHVITTNKGPLALAFPALLELASYNKVLFRFSGTVGGGTPILNFGKKCLLGDRVISIRGILNATTNYILTRMGEDKISMEDALKEAQSAGYAESDPSMDIDGFDSACKLVILANWVMNREITLKDVEINGIRNIDLKDIEEAGKKGYAIKLVATINEKEASVRPQTLPMTHPLNVDGVLNAVEYRTESAGDITLIGPGAGGVETANAILRDLIDIKRTITTSLFTHLMVS